jgi:hypothetical protein
LCGSSNSHQTDGICPTSGKKLVIYGKRTWYFRKFRKVKSAYQGDKYNTRLL